MTYCGLATMPEREELAIKTIASISPQVDRMFVVFNEYKKIPAWVDSFPNVEPYCGSGKWGDAAKFMFVDFCDGYYFSIDDDLIYPPTYVEDMIEAIDNHDCIVSLTGKWYGSLPVYNWRTDFSVRVHCLKDWVENVIVHVGGTGVMAFHTDFFDLKFTDFKRKNMADIWVAKVAHEQDVPIMALPHKANYLKYQKPSGKTIWEKNEDKQYITDLLNSFLK